MAKSKKAPAAAESSVATMIVTVASLAGKSVADLVTLFVASIATAQAAFITAAKAMIELDTRGEDSAKLLKKHGVKQSTVQNARYAVKVWFGAVKTKMLTEAQFDSMGYMDFYRLCIIADRKGGWSKLHQTGILAKPEEWQSLHERGMTRAEAEKSDKDDADRKAKLRQAEVEAEAKKLAAKVAKDEASAAEGKAKLANAPADAAPGTAATPDNPAPSAPSAETPSAESTPSTPDPETEDEEDDDESAASASSTAANATSTASKGASVQELRKLLDSAERMAAAIIAGDATQAEFVSETVVAFAGRVNDVAQQAMDAATAPAAATA